MIKFNINNVSYTPREQDSYHEKVLHFQLGYGPLFLFWQQSVVDKRANQCLHGTYSSKKTSVISVKDF